MTADADLAIIGSGFGGSLLAMIAARLGLRTILIERGHHPRFAIGESASPLAGVVLEQLADRYDLTRVRPLSAYGAWRRAYPDVACGLKRGFSYFRHESGQRYVATPERANQLLVAASPCDEIADTHWLRADVDHWLVREAVAIGVEYVDHTILDTIEWQPNGDAVLTGARERTRFRCRARFVVDASGPRGFLSRALQLDAPGFDGYPPTQALYSHFVDVMPCADLREYATSETPPYPIDAAALHHVFDGGWMWVLRFDNGVTSAGVAVTDALAAEVGLADGEPAWARLLARYPSIAAQFADARPIREFAWMPRVSYRASIAAGDRWAMLPSAAAFVDPLFSTGMPMTLLGIERLAKLFEVRGVGGDARRGPGDLPTAHDLRGYSETTLAEADHCARFIAGCYAAFSRFSDFAAYSMLYFTAASFTEMRRRLHQPTRGFLCAEDEAFASAMTNLSPARGQHHDLGVEVRCETDRINIAGLCDPAKRNWYGVDIEDAVRAAAKLDASPEAVRIAASG